MSLPSIASGVPFVGSQKTKQIFFNFLEGKLHFIIILIIIGPEPLNITFGSNMPITLLHLMLMSKIYVVNSDMKNVIGMSDPNVMFKGPGPFFSGK